MREGRDLAEMQITATMKVSLRERLKNLKPGQAWLELFEVLQGSWGSGHSSCTLGLYLCHFQGIHVAGTPGQAAALFWRVLAK